MGYLCSEVHRAHQNSAPTSVANDGIDPIVGDTGDLIAFFIVLVYCYSMVHDEHWWWKLLLVLIGTTLCVMALLAVWHTVKLPPQTNIQKARQAFTDNCRNSQQSGWTNSNNGVPNTGSENAKDWTCTFAK